VKTGAYTLIVLTIQDKPGSKLLRTPSLQFGTEREHYEKQAALHHIETPSSSDVFCIEQPGWWEIGIVDGSGCESHVERS
jgi:hypothetical protein